MADIFDTAKYILNKCGEMSTWKLQKLCYYAQAWSLAWTEKPIFNEDFQAWANGPVCPELFSVHKGKFLVSESDIPSGNPNNLSDDEKDTINVVLNDYGNLDPYDLRERTHSEQPWIQARNGLPDNARSTAIITKDSLGDYYGGL